MIPLIPPPARETRCQTNAYKKVINIAKGLYLSGDNSGGDDLLCLGSDCHDSGTAVTDSACNSRH